MLETRKRSRRVVLLVNPVICVSSFAAQVAAAAGLIDTPLMVQEEVLLLVQVIVTLDAPALVPPAALV